MCYFADDWIFRRILLNLMTLKCVFCLFAVAVVVPFVVITNFKHTVKCQTLRNLQIKIRSSRKAFHSLQIVYISFIFQFLNNNNYKEFVFSLLFLHWWLFTWIMKWHTTTTKWVLLPSNRTVFVVCALNELFAYQLLSRCVAFVIRMIQAELSMK